jgi:hypothetical protein
MSTRMDIFPVLYSTTSDENYQSCTVTHMVDSITTSQSIQQYIADEDIPDLIELID